MTIEGESIFYVIILAIFLIFNGITVDKWDKKSAVNVQIFYQTTTFERLFSKNYTSNGIAIRFLCTFVVRYYIQFNSFLGYGNKQ